MVKVYVWITGYIEDGNEVRKEYNFRVDFGGGSRVGRYCAHDPLQLKEDFGREIHNALEPVRKTDIYWEPPSDYKSASGTDRAFSEDEIRQFRSLKRDKNI